MMSAHILGFPRIGLHRELKKAVEAYWRGEISLSALEEAGTQIRQDNWQCQAKAGLDWVTVGDFSWYDQVLDTSALLGVVPERFSQNGEEVNLDTIFCMARGQAPNCVETTACEMTKWFNTNYHYIVPEFIAEQNFKISTAKLFEEVAQAQALGYQAKPVLLGPLTYLWLGKAKGAEFNKLDLLPKLLEAYNEILQKLHQQQVTWLQLDEPILVLDLPEAWQQAFIAAYQQINFQSLNCLLTTYFGSVGHHLDLINKLPVQGLHIDLCAGQEQAAAVIAGFSPNKILSLGLVNGRNVWRTDLAKAVAILTKARAVRGENVWVASSCSLLHVPVDLSVETQLDAELTSWLAFAVQKTAEINLLKNIVQHGEAEFSQVLQENREIVQLRNTSARIHSEQVQQRIASLNESSVQRQHPYQQRSLSQRKALHLPLLPTTTIGSFPQTQVIRDLRQQYKSGKITLETYQQKIQQQIAYAIEQQVLLGLDVLVHGEAERNDMVEYFGELLAGFAFTKNGWVQSYGSRCVKPPIIYGDVFRLKPMTVEWLQYAQSLTTRPVKGMLTGPVTILAWSFVRDDQPQAKTALQIALALRDEVQDLEAAGIQVIQIDEPAFREALPLRQVDWQQYLDWAVLCFRLAAAGVKDTTQIHTHMCYSEFNDIIQAIADLDADVITIENSRSQAELLQAFESFAYPNEIGPGVYDIHSPRVPSQEEIVQQLQHAAQYIPLQRLWVNPDCGLKTRNWPEVKQALRNMVLAAQALRQSYQGE